MRDFIFSSNLKEFLHTLFENVIEEGRDMFLGGSDVGGYEAGKGNPLRLSGP